MSVLSKSDLLTKIKERIGEDSSDEALSFIEDVTDTLDDFESKVKGDGEDWKAKYEENDKAWRERYKSRFFDGASDEHKDTPPNGAHSESDEENDEEAPETFDELFS